MQLYFLNAFLLKNFCKERGRSVLAYVGCPWSAVSVVDNSVLDSGERLW